MSEQEDKVKELETKYAQKAMIVGDMTYKIECLKHEMAAINQELVEVKKNVETV